MSTPCIRLVCKDQTEKQIAVIIIIWTLHQHSIGQSLGPDSPFWVGESSPQDYSTLYMYFNIQDVVVGHKDDIGLGLELSGQVVSTHSVSGTSEREIFNVHYLSNR